MSNVAIIEPRAKSVTFDMAERYGMEPAAFEQTLRATVVPSNCTKEQFAAFLLVAKEYKLNPILKEIYAFPSKGGIQPIVGVDGWANLINSHPAFDGMDFEDHLGDGGELLSITCKMYRKDRSHPVTATEYLNECKRGTDPWKQWPRRMLRHKAMIQAARYAFSFAGIVDPDEVERFAGDIAQEVRATLAERLSAAPQSGDGFSLEHIESETSSNSPEASPESQADKPATDTTPSQPTVAGDLSDGNEPLSQTAGGFPVAAAPSQAEETGVIQSTRQGIGVERGTDLCVTAGETAPSLLPPDWQDIYLTAMQRVNDKPKSLPTRHTEALNMMLVADAQPSDSEKEWMRAVYRLRDRNLKGEISRDEYDAAIREIKGS